MDRDSKLELQRNMYELEDRYSTNLFRIVVRTVLKDVPPKSFEELILYYKWENTQFKPVEWDFIFTKFTYDDTEFFVAFMSWKRTVSAMDMEDRKCCVCLSHYNKSIVPKKFRNCRHYSCKSCYATLPKGVDNYKHCVICRTSEKPN